LISHSHKLTLLPVPVYHCYRVPGYCYRVPGYCYRVLLLLLPTTTTQPSPTTIPATPFCHFIRELCTATPLCTQTFPIVFGVVSPFPFRPCPTRYSSTAIPAVLPLDSSLFHTTFHPHYYDNKSPTPNTSPSPSTVTLLFSNHFNRGVQIFSKSITIF
jgi:hypothetical protein